MAWWSRPGHRGRGSQLLPLLLLLLLLQQAVAQTNSSSETVTAHPSDGSSREKRSNSKSVDFEKGISSGARSEDLGSFVKQGEKVISSVEYEGEKNDDGGAISDAQFSNRRGKKLTWGEYISKSSEAPFPTSREIFWDTRTEAPYSLANTDIRYEQNSVPNSFSLNNQNHYANSGHFGSDVTNSNNGNTFTGGDHYSYSNHAAQGNYEEPTTSAPVTHDRVLHQLAEYLLSGSKEQATSSPMQHQTQGHTATHNSYSHSHQQQQQPQHVTYHQPQQPTMDYYSGQFPNHNYEGSQTVHGQTNPQLVPNANHAVSYSQHPMNQETHHPHGQPVLENSPAPGSEANTDDIDMTQILQDLSDLIKILPEHVEKDGSETNPSSAGAALRPETSQSHNAPSYGSQVHSMTTVRPAVNYYYDQHYPNTASPAIEVVTPSPVGSVYQPNLLGGHSGSISPEHSRLVNFASSSQHASDSSMRLRGTTEKPVNMDPIIFTSKPIFTTSRPNENNNPTHSNNNHGPGSQWSDQSGAVYRAPVAETPPAPLSVTGNTDYDDSFFNNADYEYVDTSDPAFNVSGEVVPDDEDYNEIKQKAQRRTLDLLYHMFVDPTTDKDGNRRNTLLEDLIKAVDNHIIGDVTALKEHNQSGKKGQSHFKQNKSDFFKTLLESVGFDRPFMQSTANAFMEMDDTAASATAPAGTRVPTSIHYQTGAPVRPRASNASPSFSLPQAESINQVIRQTRHPSIPNVLQTANVAPSTNQKLPQVHQLPSGDQFVITDETGHEQVVSIGDIINSLASLDDEDIKELLLSPDINRRSDHTAERHFDANPHDEFLPNDNENNLKNKVKINNLIVFGKDGSTESIPFDDILSSPGEVLDRPLKSLPPGPMALATHHLLGGGDPQDSLTPSPTMLATQHLLGLSPTRSRPQQTVSTHHHQTNNDRGSNPSSEGKIRVSFDAKNRNLRHSSHQRMTVSAPRIRQNRPSTSINQNTAVHPSSVHQNANGADTKPKIVLQREQDSHYEMSSESQKILNDLFEELHEWKPQDNNNDHQSHQLEQQNIKFMRHKAELDALQQQLQEQQRIQEEQQRALDKELEEQLLQIQYLQNKLKDTRAQQEELSQSAPASAPQTHAMNNNQQQVPLLSEPTGPRTHGLPSNEQPKPSKVEFHVENIPLQKTYVASDHGRGETNVHVHSTNAQIGQDLFDAVARNLASVEAKAKTPLPWHSDTLTLPSNAEKVKPRESSPWLSSNEAANVRTDNRNLNTFELVREEALRRQNSASKTQSILINAPPQKPTYDPEHHPNAHQYQLGSGTISLLQQTNPSSSQSQNIRFNNPPSLELMAANVPYSYNINPPTKYGENLRHRDTYQNLTRKVDTYESRRDVGISAPAQLLAPSNAGAPAYDPVLFQAQVQEKQLQDERQRAMFASTMYDQVKKSLPKPIHFKQTTTPAPPAGSSGLFGFNLPNLPNLPSIFNSAHHHEEEEQEAKDSTKEDVKWEDPLGLLRLYDLIPFTRTKSENKNKPVTPKPVSPEKRLEQALKQGNVPDHVTKILVNQMKDSKIPSMPRTDNRRHYSAPQPHPRRQQASNRRSYQVPSPSVPNTFYRPPLPFTQESAMSKIYGLSSSYEPPPAFPYKIPRSFGPPQPGSVIQGGYSGSLEGGQHYEKGVSSHFKTIESGQYDHSGGSSSFKGGGHYSKEHHHHKHHDHSGGYGSNQASEEYDSYIVPIGFKGPPKDDQPLLDVSLLFNAVKVKKVGEENESIAFPKIGDPSKFVDTGLYRVNHHY